MGVHKKDSFPDGLFGRIYWGLAVALLTVLSIIFMDLAFITHDDGLSEDLFFFGSALGAYPACLLIGTLIRISKRFPWIGLVFKGLLILAVGLALVESLQLLGMIVWQQTHR